MPFYSGEDAGYSTNGEDAGDEMGDIVGDIMGADFFASGDDAAGASPNAAELATLRKFGQYMPRHGHHGKPAPRGYQPRTVQFQAFPGHGSRQRVQPIGLSRFIPIATPTLEATNNPQFPFRVERLTIPSTIGPNFIINDFKVGNIPQFNASGPIAALTFSEQGVGVRLAGDTCYIGQAMTINVTNISGADATFFATVIGTTITRL